MPGIGGPCGGPGRTGPTPPMPPIIPGGMRPEGPGKKLSSIIEKKDLARYYGQDLFTVQRRARGIRAGQQSCLTRQELSNKICSFRNAKAHVVVAGDASETIEARGSQNFKKGIPALSCTTRRARVLQNGERFSTVSLPFQGTRYFGCIECKHIRLFKSRERRSCVTAAFWALLYLSKPFF